MTHRVLKIPIYENYAHSIAFATDFHFVQRECLSRFISSYAYLLTKIIRRFYVSRIYSLGIVFEREKSTIHEKEKLLYLHFDVFIANTQRLCEK